MLSTELVSKAIGSLIDADKLSQAQQIAKQKNTNLIDYLLSEKLLSAEEIYSTLAKYLKLPYIDFKSKTIDKKLFDLLPETIVQSHQVVIFEQDAKKNLIKVATTDPEDLQTIDFIRKKTEAEVQVYLTNPDGIQNIIKQYHKGLREEFKTDTLKVRPEDLPIVRIVDTILEYAVFEGASDIHIEPEEKDLVIRYRIDGILRDVMTLPKETQSGVVARVKVLSNLKLDEHRLPQDGRFKIESTTDNVAVRVSVIPVFDGEKIVMRLLDESKQLLNLEQSGLAPESLKIVERNIKKPHGIILVTGPTGSGKTTTLYTILNMLNTAGVNIVTIEDPIEYRMPRVNQSQINPKIGYTFASGLRSILRQDPNIIMVGEIRDQETAEIASHSAMTGHLVLSTLHTNDAIGAISRLCEMGVPNFLVSSTTNLIIAQRLVRKICPNCIQSYTLTKKEITELEKQLKLSNMLEVMVECGALDKDSIDEEINFFRGKGCVKCGYHGYKGRIGIFEVLEITPDIAEAILKNTPKEELIKLAKKQNMLTMAQDGIVKAKRGITTLEEILRVTKE